MGRRHSREPTVAYAQALIWGKRLSDAIKHSEALAIIAKTKLTKFVVDSTDLGMNSRGV